MKKVLILIIACTAALASLAQESTNTGVRRRTQASETQNARSASDASSRLAQQYSETNPSLSEGDIQWLRVIYRELDLDKGANAALYFPEEVVDGQENLFRIIMREMLAGNLKAYEYLDGKEIFTEPYLVNVKDMLERFDIYHTLAKGSTEKNPTYEVMESDVPCTEVLSYYVIEKWTFDNRMSRLKTVVEAICPVLHRVGDFGGEPLKYPMFWIKYQDLSPYLANTAVFVDDDNNQPNYSYSDFFNLGKYEGEIYKTRNLRNKSMAQLYPDADDMKRAQDSIQARLDSFENKLWVPDREEVIAAREAREATADSLGNKKASSKNQVTKTASRSQKKPVKVKASSKASSSGGTTRSVRRKK